MISKEQLLTTALRECDICVHLHSKLPEGSMDYRPTSDQRTTLELLQYLTICGIASAEAMVTGTWDQYESHSKPSLEMTADGFPQAMNAQKKKLEELFTTFSEEDLSTKNTQLPWGDSLPLGQALIECLVKFLAAYRMQLFLYAKGAGNQDIWTPNCWAGVDMEKKQPATT